MAITGPISYPPTTAQFVTHWDNVLMEPVIAGDTASYKVHVITSGGNEGNEAGSNAVTITRP